MMKEVVLLLVVAMATQTMADGANQGEELTEGEYNQAVFTITKELEAEANVAVATINEIFGNPGCTEVGLARRGIDIQKRGKFWKKLGKALKKVGKVAKKVCTVVNGKRDVQDEFLKRGLGETVKKVCKVVGKRDTAAVQDAVVEDDPQFVADVVELRQAVTVFNEVLALAEASLEQ